MFQTAGDGTELVVIRRDGTPVREVIQRTPGRRAQRTPRWAPDDKSIAYIHSAQLGIDDAIKIVSATAGDASTVVKGDIVRGLSWLPDASGLVFGSAQEAR